MSSVLYWLNSYIRKFISALASYQIFKSSKFINILSSIYMPQVARSKKLSFIIRIILVLAIVSLSFSAKIYIKSFGNEAAFIKFDDILLAILILFALPKIKDWKSTSLDLPLAIFVLICIFSIFRGMAINTINQPILSILYLFKIIQYFLLFYLMFNLISQRSEIKLYLAAIFVTAFLIGAYGVIEYFHPYAHYPSSYPFYYRIYERGYFYHDANHFAAYLMFIASVVLGLALYVNKRIFTKIGLFIAFLFLCLPLFWTYSRSAYLSLFISVLIITGIKSKRTLMFTSIIFVVFLALFAPQSVLNRIYSISNTLLSSNPSSSSIAYRLQQIKYATQTIKQYPLLGIGLGARERVFYENQFSMLISEIGILGFLAFLVVILVIFRSAIYLYRMEGSSLIRGLAAGYIGGLVGLLIDSNTLLVFMISRITGPFWIVTAVIFWLLNEQQRGFDAGLRV